VVIDYSVHSTTKLMIGQFGWFGGSLAGFLFPLHACLFQLSLLAHVVELKLKLPLPLII